MPRANLAFGDRGGSFSAKSPNHESVSKLRSSTDCQNGSTSDARHSSYALGCRLA